MPPGEARASREADRAANGGWHGENFHMPALGSEMPDPDALATIRARITTP
jgi:hypothetical protein